MDGLDSDLLKMKVMRGNPHSFEEAVNMANEEANLRKRFALRLGRDQQADRKETEDMEVDHCRGRVCFQCGKPNHTARQCQTARVNAIATRPRQEDICWRCKRPGHLRNMVSCCKMRSAFNRAWSPSL